MVSEKMALRLVGPKDMKKQKVVGPARMISAITRLGSIRLGSEFACGKISIRLKFSCVLGLIGVILMVL